MYPSTDADRLTEITAGYSLKGLDFQVAYRSSVNDIVKEFLIPALSRSVRYDRATGYFTSESFLKLSNGIEYIAKNGGKIRFITSPNLSKDDAEAIKQGYDERIVIEKAIMSEVEKLAFTEDKTSLNLLANLVKHGILEFKIAYMKSKDRIGIFHPKIGTMHDAEGNAVAFSGSMNETAAGLSDNYEFIDVFTSWNNHERVKINNEVFENLWENKEKGVIVLDFSQAIIKKINSFAMAPLDFIIDRNNGRRAVLSIPEGISIRPYQKEAIKNWEAGGYRGIFHMATGTGKTITALAALSHLFSKGDGGLATVIVCPLQHHVEQWVEIMKSFGFKPIIGHSRSIHKNWKKDLDTAVRLYNLRNIEGTVQDGFSIVTTISSFCSKSVQKILASLEGESVIVADEVHNMGTPNIIECLIDNFNYRLGLSATVERHKDRGGTDAILNYFGGICIDYGLEEAINQKMLVPYFYHPIPCYMTEDEYQEFSNMNYEIKCINNSNKSTSIKRKEMQEIEVRGATLLARMKEKFAELSLIVRRYKDENFILVYCGATRLSNSEDDELDFSVDYMDGLRVIDTATEILGKDLEMRVSQYSYKETIEERMQIKEDFSSGRTQALIAIRCLDEGVDIPAIQTAFILSSSENPKQYIQRRGRVLRRSPNKEYATIYDFIALPRQLDESSCSDGETREDELRFISREVKRMIEFSEIAINPEDTEKLLRRIQHCYYIDDIREYAHECK